MSLYHRKKIKAGLFNFNVSKTGIGVSAGVKGFRIGTCPRGNYVHIGKNSIYYKKTSFHSDFIHEKDINDSLIETPSSDKTHESFKEIDSGDVFKMIDSDSADLLNELNNKHKKKKYWPFSAILTVLLFYILQQTQTPFWISILIIVFGIALTIFLAFYDDIRKSVILFYDIESEIENKLQSLHDGIQEIMNANKLWHIESQAKVLDRKYHAGADSLIKRNEISILKKQPPYVKTNVSTPMIPVGRQKVYFFPDRILIYDRKGVGSVNYRDLHIDVSTTRFIEEGYVPKDSKIIGYTWKYVNKSGGPDRRFKDNHQIPICLYEDLWLKSDTGLNELIQISKIGTTDNFTQAIKTTGMIIKH